MTSVVINDPGGSIVQHAFDFTVMVLNGTFFKVIYCASACVMALSIVPMKQVCFYPQAWIGYHTTAQREDGTENSNTMRWERGKDWITNGYEQCAR